MKRDGMDVAASDQFRLPHTTNYQPACFYLICRFKKIFEKIVSAFPQAMLFWHIICSYFIANRSNNTSKEVITEPFMKKAVRCF